MRVSASFEFRPVGQGLFGVGELIDPRNAPSWQGSYRWVYDCGTNSAKRYLEESISRLSSRWSSHDETRPTLDLVVVSHFDHDHISGLVSLLSKFHVRDLLLPYVPLWQRLEIAFMAGLSYRSALTRFLLNPVAFVAQLPGVSVERFLFASAGGDTPDLQQFAKGGDPDFPSADEGTDAQGRDDERWPVRVLTTRQAPDEDEVACLESADNALSRVNARVEYMKLGQAITVAGVWEFVPYNDSELSHRVTSTFKSHVAKLRDRLLAASNSSDRQDALDRLKARFDLRFGSTGLRRNLISLFMYVGPVLPAQVTRARRGLVAGTLLESIFYQYRIPSRRFGAVLYTGDGFLDTTKRLSKLKTYIGPVRFSRIEVLQVMHHGSRHNWFEGIAKEFSPAISIFSSDPSRKRSHPHAEVVKDFLSYGPVQVDTCQELDIRFDLSWER